MYDLTLLLGKMVECSFTNQVVVGLSPVAVTLSFLIMDLNLKITFAMVVMI